MSIVATLIDQREPAWVRNLTFGAAHVAITLLEHSDVLLTTRDGSLVAVERKTPGDLLNSLRDGRLWEQLAGMTQQTRWCYLVVTGWLTATEDGHVVAERGVTDWRWASVQGALLRAQELGVFVAQCAAEDFEATVRGLAERDRNPRYVVPPAKVPTVLGPAERALTALPGIGLERVAPILEFCGSAAWALDWLCDLHTANQRIPGIGPGTKHNVRTALGLKENETLAVIALDEDKE